MIEFYLDEFTIGDFECLYDIAGGNYIVLYENDKIIIKLLGKNDILKERGE